MNEEHSLAFDTIRYAHEEMKRWRVTAIILAAVTLIEAGAIVMLLVR